MSAAPHARVATDPARLRRRARAIAVEPAAPAPTDGSLKLAAVLVPLVFGLAPGVLLTLRCAHLSAHPGQVSLPGGRIEPGDPGAETAALREAAEEIALDPRDVELVGRLSGIDTTTGYHVTPVLGLLPATAGLDSLRLRPAAGEVEAVFTLPLAVLLDPDAPRRRTLTVGGRERAFWVWPHPDHYIWGATAAILIDLATRLRAVPCSD